MRVTDAIETMCHGGEDFSADARPVPIDSAEELLAARLEIARLREMLGSLAEVLRERALVDSAPPTPPSSPLIPT